MFRKNIGNKLDHTADSKRNPDTLKMMNTQETAFGNVHFVTGAE